MGTTAAVAVALTRAERRVVERLIHLGATSPERARPLPELRMLESTRLRRLERANVVAEASPGKYWVDEAAYAQLRSGRRHRVWIVLAILLAVAAWFALRALDATSGR